MARGCGARRLVMMGVATVGGLMLSTAAQARYTAIDMIGPGQFKYIYFVGYCDTISGQDCGSAYTLPYTVSFSGGMTDKLSLRSDGTVQFVGDLLASPLNNVDRYQVLASVDTGINLGFQVASTEGSVTSEVSFSPPNPPVPSYILTSPILTFTWFVCDGSGAAACFNNVHSLTLTPEEGGFDVAYGGVNKNKAPEFLAAQIVPKSATAVPEPGAWALMMLGFGGIGATLRSRRSAHLIVRSLII